LSPVSSKDCLSRPFSELLRRPGKCDVTEDQLIDRYPYQTMFNEHFRGRRDICIFRQSELLLTNGRLNIVDDHDRAILRDSHHLSVYGSELMAQLLATSACGGELPWQR